MQPITMFNTYYDYGTSNSYGYISSFSIFSFRVFKHCHFCKSQRIIAIYGLSLQARGLTTSGLTSMVEDMTFTTSEASIVTMNVDMSTAA
ncbi:MAG: hypothetical protein IPH45_03525 [Bacteroidales bacterium]|nr:hypothetical protein [Bacteroidales bacterium]